MPKKDTKRPIMYEDMPLSLPPPSKSMGNYLAEINSYRVLTREEERDLAIKYRDTQDVGAARALVNANLRFVVKIANEYRNYGFPMMDVIQEGNIGLMLAVKRFDPTKGYRLISYAVWWIRAYIQNYILKSWSLVKIGTTQAQRKLFYKLRSTKSKMEMEGRLSPESYKSLAQELGVSDKSIIEMETRLGSKDMSLDAEIGEDTPHLNILVSEGDNQEEIFSHTEQEEVLKTGVAQAMENLKAREKLVLKKRILSEDPMTLEELGNELNLSRERVRQIESSALKKIKNVLKLKGLDV